MKAGIVSVTFREKTAEELLGLCSKTRLSVIEWSENAHALPGGGSDMLELMHKTTEAGLEVAGYGSYYRLGMNDPEAFRASLASAVVLGAPVIRVWAGEKGSAVTNSEERRKIASDVAVIADIAAEKGIKIATEWHRNTLTDTNESALALLLDEAAHPNFYTLWQPTPELTFEARREGLRALGGRVLNLHVYHWPQRIRMPLSRGVDEWRQYFGVLDSTERCALIEFVRDDTEQQFFEDAAVLCDWVNEYNSKI